MNNGLIIDAVFALVLIFGAVFGAKRGLFRSLMALVTILAALIGASLLAEALTPPVTEALMPRVEKSVQEWFDAEGRQDGTAQLPVEDAAGMQDEASGAETADDGVLQDVSGALERLLRFDFDGAVRDSLRRSAQDAALAAVRTLLASIVRTLLFVLGFLLLTLLLRLLTRGLDRIFDLPVLRTLNTLGGGALGVIESALLLFLICDLAPKLGVTVLTENVGDTYLLAFFMDHTPRSLAAAILP